MPSCTTLPWFITAMRSDTAIASSWSCVTYTVRDREPPLQLADLLPHLDAQLGVEIRQRLVEQQHARPDDDRARERDALLLAARELAGELLLVAGEPDERQHVADRARRSRRRACARTRRP